MYISSGNGFAVPANTKRMSTSEIKSKHSLVKEHCGPRCPRCQGSLKTVNVHGHDQCVVCGSIVDDCCQGEALCEGVQQKSQ